VEVTVVVVLALNQAIGRAAGGHMSPSERCDAVAMLDETALGVPAKAVLDGLEAFRARAMPVS